jgi:hypothetical protein
MVRIEQFRGELLERLERVDRRLVQNEQRVGRIDQRLSEIADRMEALRLELLEQLELLATETPVADFLLGPGVCEGHGEEITAEPDRHED